jgi:flavin-dependent dehydrogenase
VSLVGSPDFVQIYREPERLRLLLDSSLCIACKLSSSGHGGAHFQIRRTSKHAALYLLGDAAESFDPACGLGMTHALYTGITASDSVMSALKWGESPPTSLRSYLSRQARYGRGIRHFSHVVRLFMRLFYHAPKLFTPIRASTAGRLITALERLALPAAPAPSPPIKSVSYEHD